MNDVRGSALTDLIASYPEVMAVALLIASVIVARAARYLAERTLALVNRGIARSGGGRGELLADRTISRLAALVFFAVLAVGILLALRTLGTGRVFTWIDIPLAYVPRVFVGAVIIVGGWVLGVVARNLVHRFQARSGDTALTPRVVQGAIFLIAIMTGLQHMGLNVSFLAQLLILVVGVCLAGLSLAFALGARQYVANLVARSVVARYAPGDRLRIDEVDGTVVEIHRAGVDIATAEGIVTVPSARFAEVAVLRREAPDPEDPDAWGDATGSAEEPRA